MIERQTNVYVERKGNNDTRRNRRDTERDRLEI